MMLNKRLIASTIDIVIISAFLIVADFLVSFALFFISSDSTSYWPYFSFAVIPLLLYVRDSGRLNTIFIGKRLFGIYIINIDGSTPSTLTLLSRSFLLYIMPYIIILVPIVVTHGIVSTKALHSISGVMNVFNSLLFACIGIIITNIAIIVACSNTSLVDFMVKTRVYHATECNYTYSSTKLGIAIAISIFITTLALLILNIVFSRQLEANAYKLVRLYTSNVIHPHVVNENSTKSKEDAAIKAVSGILDDLGTESLYFEYVQLVGSDSNLQKTLGIDNWLKTSIKEYSIKPAIAATDIKFTNNFTIKEGTKYIQVSIVADRDILNSCILQADLVFDIAKSLKSKYINVDYIEVKYYHVVKFDIMSVAKWNEACILFKNGKDIFVLKKADRPYAKKIELKMNIDTIEKFPYYKISDNILPIP